MKLISYEVNLLCSEKIKHLIKPSLIFLSSRWCTLHQFFPWLSPSLFHSLTQLSFCAAAALCSFSSRWWCLSLVHLHPFYNKNQPNIITQKPLHGPPHLAIDVFGGSKKLVPVEKPYTYKDFFFFLFEMFKPVWDPLKNIFLFENTRLLCKE